MINLFFILKPKLSFEHNLKKIKYNPSPSEVHNNIPNGIVNYIAKQRTKCTYTLPPISSPKIKGNNLGNIQVVEKKNC